MKVVINTLNPCLDLSLEAEQMLAKRKDNVDIYFYNNIKTETNNGKYISHYTKVKDNNNIDIENTVATTCDYGDSIYDIENKLEFYTKNFKLLPRNDIDLVEVVELLGDKANGYYSKLKIIEIPNDVEFEVYHIFQEDGESIHEKHRIWR